MAKQQHHQDTGKVFHDLFREIFRLHAALASVMDGVHEQAGLSTPQAKIMRVLRHSELTTVPDIAATLGVSRQFVQTVCNDLLSRGLIEFADNPRHKRSKLVIITEAGLSAYQTARHKENDLIERSLPGIDPDQATAAHELLVSIRKAVQRLFADS